MDDQQEMTSPLDRFFAFWWILAGFLLFGVLALVTYAFAGKKNDPMYEQRAEERHAVRQEVEADQAKQFADVEVDLAAGVAALSGQKPTKSTAVVSGSQTHIEQMAIEAEKEKQRKAEEDAKKAAAAKNGEGPKVKPQEITINSTNPLEGQPPMNFVEKEMTAVAGKPIALTFNNPDAALITGHNLVVCKPGTLKAVSDAAIAQGADPNFIKRGYVPDSEDIIIATGLLLPGKSQTLEFTIGAPGDYPYVCTFPGHSLLMHGVLKVTAAK